MFETGSPEEQQELKESFGLGDLEHNDDFGVVLEWAPWLWQSNQFYQAPGFYEWCDAIENVSPNSTAALPGADGVGLEKALAGYATVSAACTSKGRCPLEKSVS